MTLEDNEGHPWTAAIGIGWIIMLAAFTSGTALLALSIYLALWIRCKNRSSLPLVGFSLVGLLAIAAWLLPRTFSGPHLDIYTGVLATFLCIGSTFALRHEVRIYIRESERWDIPIGPWFTLFFSAIYINYCINPTTIHGNKKYPDTVTSLDLSSPAPKNTSPS